MFNFDGIFKMTVASSSKSRGTAILSHFTLKNIIRLLMAEQPIQTLSEHLLRPQIYFTTMETRQALDIIFVSLRFDKICIKSAFDFMKQLEVFLTENIRWKIQIGFMMLTLLDSIFLRREVFRTVGKHAQMKFLNQNIILITDRIFTGPTKLASRSPVKPEIFQVRWNSFHSRILICFLLTEFYYRNFHFSKSGSLSKARGLSQPLFRTERRNMEWCWRGGRNCHSGSRLQKNRSVNLEIIFFSS